MRACYITNKPRWPPTATPSNADFAIKVVTRNIDIVPDSIGFQEKQSITSRGEGEVRFSSLPKSAFIHSIGLSRRTTRIHLR